VLCYKSALFWDFTQRRMVVSSRRVGTTYWSHLQGSSTPWNQTLTYIASGCPREWKILGAHPEQLSEVKSRVTSDRTSNCARSCKKKSSAQWQWQGEICVTGMHQQSLRKERHSDGFKNRVLGENIPTTKKTSSSPLQPTAEHAAVTDNAIFKFW